MTGRLTYLPGALQRIKRFGEDAIVTFFNEIPKEKCKGIIELLPSPPGFRPGTNAAVQRQLRSLAHKIAVYRTPKSFPRSVEEVTLYGLWAAWSESQITETVIVRELLDCLEANGQSAQLDKSEQMAAAIKAIIEAGKCAQEILDRFIAFSPFENIDEFLELAKGAPKAAEIERDTAILSLPRILHESEAQMQLLETKLDALDQNTSKLRSDSKEIRRAVSDLRAKAAEDRAVINEVKQATNRFIESRKVLEEELARLARAAEPLESRVAVNETRLENVAESQLAFAREVARATISIGQLSEQISACDGRLAQIETNLRLCVAQLNSQGEGLSKLNELVVRIDQLESMILETGAAESHKVMAIEAGREGQRTPDSGPQLAEPALTVERLRIEAGLSVKPLRSVAEILSSLDAALVEAGLKKSIAATFAEEILAAATSEQVVFFRGGFAVDVARKCALSLSGTAVFRVAIPLGLTDPSRLRQPLSSRLDTVGNGLTSIVIEGINNSPLDVLRDVLLDQVSRRVGSIGRQSPTIIFGSWVDGAGAFPVEPSCLELGPVFDLEQMDWRRLRREKLPVLGSIAAGDWQSIAASWDGNAIDYEETLLGAQQLAPKRNSRIEANVVRAFSAIKAIRRQPGLTPLQSVTFGWLAPYWQSLAANADNIETQIDGGKCDGTVVDERLKTFLAEYRKEAAVEFP